MKKILKLSLLWYKHKLEKKITGPYQPLISEQLDCVECILDIL